MCHKAFKETGRIEKVFSLVREEKRRKKKRKNGKNRRRFHDRRNFSTRNEIRWIGVESWFRHGSENMSPHDVRLAFPPIEFTWTESSLIKLTNLSHSISRPQLACEPGKCHGNIVARAGEMMEKPSKNCLTCVESSVGGWEIVSLMIVVKI